MSSSNALVYDGFTELAADQCDLLLVVCPAVQLPVFTEA